MADRYAKSSRHGAIDLKTAQVFIEAQLALAELYARQMEWARALEVTLPFPEGLYQSSPQGDPAKATIFAAMALAEQLAVQHPDDRRQQLLLLDGYVLLGRIHRGLGEPFDALRNYDIGRRIALGIMRRDEDLAAPRDAMVQASYEMAQIYREAEEHGKRLDALQDCYDYLLESRQRGTGAESRENRFAKLPEELVDATIHRFYVVSGARGTLEESTFYADEVDYLGSGIVGRERIAEEQNRWRDKYPMRYYRIDRLDNLAGDAQTGFQVTVRVLWWLGTPSGSIHVAKPDGGGTYEFALAFDPANRLRITRIHYVGKLNPR